jgi:hypothetical protein
MATTSRSASEFDWRLVADALSSPKLRQDEKIELLRLAMTSKADMEPLIESIGADNLAEVYFSHWHYKPNPGPQTAFLFSSVDEIFYGGARGGSKSFGCLLHFRDHAETWGRLAKGVIFRRRFVDLEDLIRDSFEVFEPLGWRFFAGGNRPQWRSPQGAILRFRYLQNEKDAEGYQGQAFTVIYVEEAGTYGSPRAIDLLRGCLRSAHGVPCQLILNANPGGRGHNWLKMRYIDPAPPRTVMEETLEPPWGPPIKWRRVFIPAKLSDNPHLAENDPMYVARIMQAGPDWLVKAWLDGDWDIVAGGMFDDILGGPNKDRIIIPGFRIPAEWRIYRALDWGSAKPFSVGWWAISDGSAVYEGDRLVGKWPGKTLFRVAEWYGSRRDKEDPNVGLRMLASDVGEGIKEREEGLFPEHRVLPGPADSSIYVSDGVSRSLADELKDPKGDGSNRGVTFVPSDKGAGSRISGWEALRRTLKNSLEVPPEHPGMFVFERCRDWIRTMPTLPRDESNPEDVDTDSEDHIADETRYMLTTKRPEVKVDRRGW